VTDKTRLLRQVNPNFIQHGEIGVVTFRPNDADMGLLSVYDNDLISPENSHKHWTDELKKKSVGVLAVTFEECASVELPAVSSPVDNNEAHAHIDFTAYEKKDQRTKTKALLEFALARQWLFQSEA
jgi:hypothetical protein